jgi:hypothetical protein
MVITTTYQYVCLGDIIHDADKTAPVRNPNYHEKIVYKEVCVIDHFARLGAFVLETSFGEPLELEGFNYGRHRNDYIPW